ncbi:helix-turn-helix transcriptional regulator [Cryptosporangium sp. NPDC048952]|uniref:helix-turn-helix transcriptional regulator n=1 Tax=Cryptosporangium sp. NPDC048952 TaxID=3363961 RepID=UPI00371766EF
MPVNVIEVSTSDPEEAHHTINQIYAPGAPVVLSGRTQDFAFRLRSSSTGELSGELISHTMSVRSRTGATPTFSAGALLSGGITFPARTGETSLRRGGVVRYPAEADLECCWDDVELATVRIPLVALETVAESSGGFTPGEWCFTDVTPVSADATARWQSLNRYVHRSLNSADPTIDSPLVRAAMVELIATTALDVFPNTILTAPYRPGPGGIAPAALRRAAAFIDTHAREPISLAQIAAAAGATGRAVRAAFHRQYGTTPLGYLRRVRLEGAHRDLQAADPTAEETVAVIAARWGFGHRAWFVQSYRRQYGVLPSQTLHA